MTSPNLIGLDWGTSSLRAYLFGRDGAVLAQRETPEGIQAIPDSSFRAVFERLCGEWLAAHPDLPVIACGMIGSRQGWREAPYAATPAGFDELASALTAIDDLAGRRFRIVPGIWTISASGTHDVIRGEETQVFGALERLGLRDARLVMPGTHSKWVSVRDGRIIGFRTYMTGELYSVLARHSILGRMFENSDTPIAADQDQAFLDGLARAAEDPAALTSLLFSVRAEGLFGRYDGRQMPSYLSGLLLGTEVAHACRAGLDPTRNQADPTGKVGPALDRAFDPALDPARNACGDEDLPTLLVGSDALVPRYALALERAGISAMPVPDAPVAAAFVALARQAGLLA